ncbi:MaoC family dehydratase, partial [Streptomyces sp. SID8455]|nr:MaoC family dehydratase [Streptomyces sp. SID8455]
MKPGTRAGQADAPEATPADGAEAPDQLYERLSAYAGRPAATAGTGRDPVNAPMIRHWCEAMGDTSPAY